MKNAFKVILMCLVVLGVVYASTGPEKKAKEIENKAEEVEKKAKEAEEQTECVEEKTKEIENETEESEKKTEKVENKAENTWYKPVDICKFPVSMEVGHFVQLKECNKRKIKLVQVDCKSIGRDGGDFPCYSGSEEFEVRANFPAIFDASLSNTSPIIAETKVYWKDDINQISGSTGRWEKLTVCIDAWKTKIWKASSIGETPVGDITIQVRPPDETKDDTKNEKESEE